ncbi:MAG: radical SAM protein [Thermodesulfobacteriota bacterium]
MDSFSPAYLSLCKNGELSRRARMAREKLSACDLCPRSCGVNRLAGETGVCGVGENALVASFHAHFGEEAPLVGTHGSGTIFFSGCNLLCLFCQNFEISHGREGREASPHELAAVMLHLADQGCHNINLVTPSHVVPQFLAALDLAAAQGLRLPVVYNTSGYDSLETLRLLDGVVDIYMPDLKFIAPEVAQQACDAPDYPDRAREAVREMHRQVGDLTKDNRGVARRGLLVRHLVLPDSLAGTREVMRFLAREISPDTYVNVMSQYRPCGKAASLPGFTREITAEEFREAMEMAGEAGLTRLDRPRRTILFAWDR